MVRLISQYTTLIFGIISLSIALYGMRKSSTPWLMTVGALYAFVDVAFYTTVLIFNQRGFGNEMSPYRAVIHSAIVLAVMYCYSRGDFRSWRT